MARCENEPGPSKPGVAGSIPAGHAAFPSEIEGDAGSTGSIKDPNCPHCVPTAGTAEVNARTASRTGYVDALKSLRRVCDRRGFKLRFDGDAGSIRIRNRRGQIILLGFSYDREYLVESAREYLRTHHHRLPGAPKGNRNARRENRRRAA